MVGFQAGVTVDAGGDVNGDGVADVLLGATGAEEGRGAVYLVHGPVSGGVLVKNADAEFVGEEIGDSLSRAWWADLDGDAYSDVLLGAPGRSHTGSDEGVIYMLRGGG